MEKQIRENFLKAMQDSLEKSMMMKDISNVEVEWICKLCVELKQRINNLTPSRKDMHEELDKSIDLVIIKQMLRNDAFEKEDAFHIINCIFERLQKLCAPCQDEDIKQVITKILSMKSIPRQLSSLIMESNRIIDEIEKLYQDFHNTKA